MLLRTLSFIPVFYKSQYQSPEKLERFQEKRLKYIVDFAYRNTALYKEKFKKAGIRPSDIQSLTDITKIPVITKEELRAVYPHGCVAPGYNEHNCVVEHTSGSSGSIFTVLFNPEAMALLRAVSFRSHLAQGVRPWHKFCILCRDREEYEFYKQWSLYRTYGILEGRPEKELLETIKTLTPHILGGHPSAYVALAKTAAETGITITPHFILLGGELSLPWHREYIEKVFQCPTLNRYGAYEMNSIAWECDHKTMHIDADAVILEIINEGEPVTGESGEVIVTNLWNEAMPFIRYRLGDIGVVSDDICACGRGLPVLQDIQGRTDDFIVLPTGELVPPTRPIAIFFATPGIEQFIVIQDTKEHITVKVVPQKGFTTEIEKTLMDRLKKALGPSVVIDIKRVDTIPLTGKGKFRTIVSQVGVNLTG